ncbi:hypothetical protein C8F04DRAFT_1240875 [Mycena alexandri]|uniref:Uncharacterized protein n=1 Tax=Mycena alexandri TaxID=1745969 RepID=A0AAD6S7E3_9AGAR|nr:hypothetical protein C8F04DRAFT_1240875 [Mycena alexandri]
MSSTVLQLRMIGLAATGGTTREKTRPDCSSSARRGDGEGIATLRGRGEEEKGHGGSGGRVVEGIKDGEEGEERGCDASTDAHTGSLRPPGILLAAGVLGGASGRNGRRQEHAVRARLVGEAMGAACRDVHVGAEAAAASSETAEDEANSQPADGIGIAVLTLAPEGGGRGSRERRGRGGWGRQKGGWAVERWGGVVERRGGLVEEVDVQIQKEWVPSTMGWVRWGALVVVNRGSCLGRATWCGDGGVDGSALFGGIHAECNQSAGVGCAKVGELGGTVKVARTASLGIAASISRRFRPEARSTKYVAGLEAN